MAKDLAQLEPGSLVGRQEGDSGLFRVVAHEDGHKQRQDEDGAEQVENDKVDRVALRRSKIRLRKDSSDAHGTPQAVCPAFLGHNLEQDEERVSKVVKVVIRVRSLARG